MFSTLKKNSWFSRKSWICARVRLVRSLLPAVTDVLLSTRKSSVDKWREADTCSLLISVLIRGMMMCPRCNWLEPVLRHLLKKLSKSKMWKIEFNPVPSSWTLERNYIIFSPSQKVCVSLSILRMPNGVYYAVDAIKQVVYWVGNWLKGWLPVTIIEDVCHRHGYDTHRVWTDEYEQRLGQRPVSGPQPLNGVARACIQAFRRVCEAKYIKNGTLFDDYFSVNFEEFCTLAILLCDFWHKCKYAGSRGRWWLVLETSKVESWFSWRTWMRTVGRNHTCGPLGCSQSCQNLSESQKQFK